MVVTADTRTREEISLKLLYRVAEVDCREASEALAANERERQQLLSQQRQAFAKRNSLLSQCAFRRTA